MCLYHTIYGDFNNMNELLQKLLEAQVLSEETKKELEAAFTSKLDEAIETAKTQAAADIRAELTEQFVKERDALIDAVDTKVGEFLEQEVGELKEDIERFRDLEAEYAEKVVENKAAIADEVKNDLGELVEKLDAFLEMRLAAELEELREDVSEVRKSEFGKKIFEAFAQEFINNYADEDSAEATLAEASSRVEELELALENSNRKLGDVTRKIKLGEVLSPLGGRQREVMEMILKNVDTDKLEEAYKTFIGRVVRESAEAARSEKEDKVLAEGASKRDGKSKKEQLKEDLKSATVATGDNEDTIIRENVQSQDAKNKMAHLRRLAGLAN